MLRRRLYLQIYFTIIASLVIVVVSSGLLWSVFGRDHLNHEVFRCHRPAGLPLAPRRRCSQQRATGGGGTPGRELGIEISLFDRYRRLIASSGEASPPSPRLAPSSGWHRMHAGPAWALDLPDGRWLVADLGQPRRAPFIAESCAISGQRGAGRGTWRLSARAAADPPA